MRPRGAPRPTGHVDRSGRAAHSSVAGFGIALSLRRCQRTRNPLWAWRSLQPLWRAVQPALEPKVIPGVGIRFDVYAVDAHRRRAEEALGDRGRLRLDPPQPHLISDPCVGNQLAQPRQKRLVARAVVEVEKLDLHLATII